MHSINARYKPGSRRMSKKKQQISPEEANRLEVEELCKELRSGKRPCKKCGTDLRQCMNSSRMKICPDCKKKMPRRKKKTEKKAPVKDVERPIEDNACEIEPQARYLSQNDINVLGLRVWKRWRGRCGVCGRPLKKRQKKYCSQTCSRYAAKNKHEVIEYSTSRFMKLPMPMRVLKRW